MWRAWLPLQERAKQASVDASTSYDLEFDRVEVGEMWEVPLISWRDATSNTTRIDVLIAGGGYDHLVGQAKPGVAGSVYTLARPFWIGEGRRLVVRFVGGGATDEVEAWVTGRRMIGWTANPGPWPETRPMP